MQRPAEQKPVPARGSRCSPRGYPGTGSPRGSPGGLWAAAGNRDTSYYRLPPPALTVSGGRASVSPSLCSAGRGCSLLPWPGSHRCPPRSARREEEEGKGCASSALYFGLTCATPSSQVEPGRMPAPSPASWQGCQRVPGMLLTLGTAVEATHCPLQDPLIVWPNPALAFPVSHMRRRQQPQLSQAPACPLINVISKVSRPDACSSTWSITSRFAAQSRQPRGGGGGGRGLRGMLSLSWGLWDRLGTRGLCGQGPHPASPAQEQADPQLDVWAVGCRHKAERHWAPSSECPGTRLCHPTAPGAGVPDAVPPVTRGPGSAAPQGHCPTAEAWAPPAKSGAQAGAPGGGGAPRVGVPAGEGQSLQAQPWGPATPPKRAARLVPAPRRPHHPPNPAPAGDDLEVTAPPPPPQPSVSPPSGGGTPGLGMTLAGAVWG